MIVSPGLPAGFRNFSQSEQLGRPLMEMFGPNEVATVDPSITGSITTPGGAVAYAEAVISQPTARLINGDFEIGQPAAPSNWTAIAGPTVTSEAGARTGGTGSWFARVANVAPATIGFIRPTVDAMVIGKRYRLVIWLRASSAGGNAQVKDGGAVVLCFTSSTSWTKCQVDFTATTTELRLYIFEAGAPASEHADFDDCTLTELFGAYQNTAGNRPTHDQANNCITFVAASSHYLNWVAPNAAAGTIWMWIKPAGVAGNYAVGTVTSGSPEYCAVYVKPVTNEIRFDLGSLLNNSGVNAPVAQWSYVAVSWGGGAFTWQINGATGAGAMAGSLPITPLFVGARNNGLGTAAFHFNGSIGQHGILSRACFAAEIAAKRILTYRAP